MKKLARRLMPASPEVLFRNRLLRPLGPWIADPRLWHMRRRAVAVGAAIGAFFAFIIPVGQIPLSVVLATVLRANVPVACLATFVNTPLTFGPVYYAAYLTGGWLLGIQPAPASDFEHAAEDAGGWLAWFVSQAVDVAEPLAIGVVTFAVVSAIAAYFLVHTGWRLSVSRRWRRRSANGRQRAAAVRHRV